MKRSLFALAVMLVCALGMASMAAAQGSTYSNGGLTVNVPSGWQAENSPEGGIILGSSDAAMTLLRDSQGTLAPTDVAMSIVPPSFFAQIGMTPIDPEQTLSEIMGLLRVSAPITPYTQDGLNGVTAKVRSLAVPSGYAELYALDIDGAIILVLVQVVQNSPGATLSQTLLPTIRYEAPATPTNLVSGKSIVDGELTNTAPVQTYRVELTAGDRVTIELAAVDRAFDAFLSIYAEADYPGGAALASNDDSGDMAFGTLNSRIAALTIPTSGSYIIEATSLSRIGTGAFQLGIGGDNSYVLIPVTITSRANLVSGSAIVEGELTTNALRQAYRVNLAAGDVITLELASVNREFDAFLSIYAQADYPSGAALASNDDSGDMAFGTLNSRIAALTIPTSGDYIIEATSLSRLGTGAFQLGIGGRGAYTLTPIVVEVPTELVSGSAIVEGELTTNAPRQAYRVNLAAGDVITLELAAVNFVFDPFLSLFAEANYPNGQPLVTNDDSGDAQFGSLNSRIRDFAVATSGNYIIEATSFSRTGTGAFQLGIGGRGAYSLVSLSDAPATSSPAGAAIRQWAASATGTSQYGSSGWSFTQATGAPNTNACGDISSAWASSSSRGQDSLTLTYTTPVIPAQVNIYQTYNPGSIIRVEVGNSRTGQTFVLPNSTDAPGNTPCPGVFTVDITGVNTPIDTVTIVLDQRIGGNWNEIDAVELVGRAG